MTAFSAIDHGHMAHALRLAERGLYTTQPNPRVGCVITDGEAVIGEGWHRRAGQPHAEVFALREAGERARGATAYVTLEPCAHQGRTPPCAQALVAAGLARVVIAAEDPFAQVAGRGIAMLRGAGIRVDIGLMRDAARELNLGFFSRIERGRPWLRVKLAMSLDGRTALANGESKWITGEAARADVQRWRARSSAILTGSGTVLADNPRLTVRLPVEDMDDAAMDALPGAAAPTSSPPRGDDCMDAGGRAMHGAIAEGWGEGDALDVSEDKNAAVSNKHDEETRSAGAPRPSPLHAGERAFAPLRVVLDRQLRTPAGSHVLDGSAPTLILHSAAVDKSATTGDERADAFECLPVPEQNDALDLVAVLALLAERGCNEVQVEAGPVLCGALFAAGLVDELLLYVAPLLLGDSARPLLHLPSLNDMADRWKLRAIEQRQVGSDWRLRLRPVSAA